jgi:hypothetical protein
MRLDGTTWSLEMTDRAALRNYEARGMRIYKEERR